MAIILGNRNIDFCDWNTQFKKIANILLLPFSQGIHMAWGPILVEHQINTNNTTSSSRALFSLTISADRATSGYNPRQP